MFEFYLQKKGDFEYSKLGFTVPKIGIVKRDNYFGFETRAGWEAHFDTKFQYVYAQYSNENTIYFRSAVFQILGFGIYWKWQNGY